jgi:hypothetical protein
LTNDRPVTLLPELERLLSKRSPQVAADIRRVAADLRPCVTLHSRRAGDVPLRGRFIDRLIGRPPPEPRLPQTASKFGGIPYAEHPSELSGGRFIGQINFSEVVQALTMQQRAVPEGMPVKGLLGIDLVPGVFHGRVRWYPNPLESRAVRPSTVEYVAKYEVSVSSKEAGR